MVSHIRGRHDCITSSKKLRLGLVPLLGGYHNSETIGELKKLRLVPLLGGGYHNSETIGELKKIGHRYMNTGTKLLLKTIINKLKSN